MLAQDLISCKTGTNPPHQRINLNFQAFGEDDVGRLRPTRSAVSATIAADTI
jgi:hypothetical protein